ncbi:VOC family protein [Arthrobacter sedimenti]|uniref:VOC family protein n=1 Tax=Arthrobacter sedimenti TaxID=2694931 RepID=UPI000B355C4E|nr:VOC family protein [Arthrobacter sedimenti]OUM39437.1 glyoxalase [Arthrobacter agilis]
MDQQLHFITVATRDLDAGRSFYRELGWTPTLDVPGEIIFYQVAPGLLLGLFLDDKFTQDVGLDATPVPTGVTLSHNVDNPAEVSRVVSAMAAAGAAVLKEPGDGAFGGVFHALVRDPNGIVWEIAHNPGWRIDEAGAVVLS